MKWSIIPISVSCLGSCKKFLLCQIHAFLFLSLLSSVMSVGSKFASSLHGVITMRCFRLRITDTESWPFEIRCFLFNLEHFYLFRLVLSLSTLTLVKGLNEKNLAVSVRGFGH